MTFTYDIETWFKVNAHHLLTCSLSITMSKIMTRGEKVWSKTRFQRYLLWPLSLTLKLGSRSLHTLYLNALWKYEKIQICSLFSISMIQRKNSNSSICVKVNYHGYNIVPNYLKVWGQPVQVCGVPALNEAKV